MRRITKSVVIIPIAVVLAGLTSLVAVFVLMHRPTAAPAADATSKQPPAKVALEKSTDDSAEVRYTGESTLVANTFAVTIPDGWRASIADTGSFQAVMFARPEQIATLTYESGADSKIDRGGIPAWNGLTEHFFITAPSAEQAFNPSDHREVTSEQFDFDDGAKGTKYTVLKHADEAQQYGGLLRDNEWQGRTYVYEKDGRRVEAHLALYPSSSVDKQFFESVAATITLK